MGEYVNATVQKLLNGLIVSCQVDEANPLAGVEFIRAITEAVCLGGCVGVRINGTENVRAAKQAVSVPVLGIIKRFYDGSEVYITPTRVEVESLVEAGADVIALDATSRSRPDGSQLHELIDIIHAAGRVAMADVSTFKEGIKASECGADLVATTLSGYTANSRQLEGPDYDLISRLCEAIPVPVIAEGRIWTPRDAQMALAQGAYAVVVGTAITNPTLITQRFVAALSESGSLTALPDE